MSERYAFHLPDLGEGLPDATVVEWLVKPGESVQLDEPLVAMETAKAVVEVPSPCSGKLLNVAGEAGSVITTGHVLAEFEIDPSARQRAAGHDTGHHHHAPAKQETKEAAPSKAAEQDAGTVVGAMSASDQVREQAAVSVGGVKAMPAVRALARKLGVDIARVTPSGADGIVTLQDVKHAASAGTAAPTASGALPRKVASEPAPAPAAERTVTSASGRPMRTQPPGVEVSGQPQPLTGVRRNMARVMAQAQAEVVLTTLSDDADIQAWSPGNDLTARLIRALVAACRVEPALNAWFDGEKLTRTLHSQVDVGLAVDTAEGLFVPALRNADMLDLAATRQAIGRLRQQVEQRSLPASELTGYTISLSNFGKFAGRYATPIVVPPTVAILAAGRLRYEVVPVMGGVETHRLIPLSLSFDHRAVTGGEAARFLRGVLDDLALPQ
ncbi:dihydrolipoamide acetyltransferase family protein [Pseudomarimonas arenosa]|uniref:Dihydrolipoamide acetyltransferase component of pyruvate dehydrogenase complex n=1 Tax=Pseudomarimonas arenosa TaxID=2774145 RepID=A0AAW3ZJQ7_9GAMM|nr:dihydrolipoamide acetyltransferase family protein [Pseudomarimonas arenosa]MBD8524932.1 2-oxo acid dehydrogenase subunit E2 [Pseudomarimonas arenosa]